jgi:uncharacterized protein YbjT (DUF2867 family)
MYVITGATGNTGRGIVEQLKGEGDIVRVIGRNQGRLRGLLARGIEPYVCDLADTDKLIEAFTGADAAYVMIPPAYDPLHRMRIGGRSETAYAIMPAMSGSSDVRSYQERISDSLASAIKEAGVQHVVTLSCVGADKSDGKGLVAGLHSLEQKLNQITGLNVLHLRAGYFMENSFAQIQSILSKGNCSGALQPELKIPMIATRDISAVAADELLRCEFTGKQTRELLGQRDISVMEAASILGKAIGLPGLEYVQVSDNQARSILDQSGVPLNLANMILEVAHAINSGDMKPLPRTARNTTATSYETFAKEEFLPRFRQSQPLAA